VASQAGQKPERAGDGLHPRLTPGVRTNPLFGDHMSKVALFVKYKTLPGKRDEVRKVWMRHMQPNIASNPAHEAYFYCFDNNDPDSICAFQHYTDLESAQNFLKTEGYADSGVD
jgi:quinol monooxygenase YgiN